MPCLVRCALGLGSGRCGGHDAGSAHARRRSAPSMANAESSIAGANSKTSRNTAVTSTTTAEEAAAGPVTGGGELQQSAHPGLRRRRQSAHCSRRHARPMVPRCSGPARATAGGSGRRPGLRRPSAAAGGGVLAGGHSAPRPSGLQVHHRPHRGQIYRAFHRGRVDPRRPRRHYGGGAHRRALQLTAPAAGRQPRTPGSNVSSWPEHDDTLYYYIRP